MSLLMPSGASMNTCISLLVSIASCNLASVLADKTCCSLSPQIETQNQVLSTWLFTEEAKEAILHDLPCRSFLHTNKNCTQTKICTQT